jgi:hypothetical protein
MAVLHDLESSPEHYFILENIMETIATLIVPCKDGKEIRLTFTYDLSKNTWVAETTTEVLLDLCDGEFIASGIVHVE